MALFNTSAIQGGGPFSLTLPLKGEEKKGRKQRVP
jgi:hypothetical protein